ncbi:cyclopropane fatty-acyl-phospholipid synthase-like methyltransferase [Kitasatospora sp. GAS204A]|uniref:class I SAM-dependent methyltransferase n=1 Tax=unclassified Kitasatospora TaxID=2633591 RepID=UPI0024732E4C|nr:class I SAM-dependent methyltransferase [Kitasatospora sp. GAS204B]MDH6121686.1 cyclopropane fatty-acyl-phospholipid synthase-like methyltransferase [Kitasatospora sp. GAS204B]
MDRQERSRLAHTHHPITAPLTDESLAAVLRRAVRHGNERVLHLGCGSGAWLLRALAAHLDLTADGVDPDPAALTEARIAAEHLGVIRRLGLHHKAPAEFTPPHPYDLVLCIGATPAFDTLAATLSAADHHLSPGGTLLLGTGYWQRPPEQAARESVGHDLVDLPTLTDHLTTAGWLPIHGHTSTRAELDDYEWSQTGTLTEWALDHPAHPAATEATQAAAEHRTAWLRGYREAFGFVTLLLRRAE